MAGEQLARLAGRERHRQSMWTGIGESTRSASWEKTALSSTASSPPAMVAWPTTTQVVTWPLSTSVTVSRCPTATGKVVLHGIEVATCPGAHRLKVALPSAEVAGSETGVAGGGTELVTELTRSGEPRYAGPSVVVVAAA